MACQVLSLTNTDTAPSHYSLLEVGDVRVDRQAEQDPEGDAAAGIASGEREPERDEEIPRPDAWPEQQEDNQRVRP